MIDQLLTAVRLLQKTEPLVILMLVVSYILVTNVYFISTVCTIVEGLGHHGW
jgi:hypothetical protein